ncbi:hypothetical protein FA95DRAFT_602699 [Auriscalpium vulgare]|uniref:Uncharacterized protein n=1 Tax=Auriscalpium vulgare TaxID=40419 RepID=A0ACB8S307_9AGAM|nr:hypothetical protein FA95DRAFT_602699 [Auriscalpium vulgare]
MDSSAPGLSPDTLTTHEPSTTRTHTPTPSLPGALAQPTGPLPSNSEDPEPQKPTGPRRSLPHDWRETQARLRTRTSFASDVSAQRFGVSASGPPSPLRCVAEERERTAASDVSDPSHMRRDTYESDYGQMPAPTTPEVVALGRIENQLAAIQRTLEAWREDFAEAMECLRPQRADARYRVSDGVVCEVRRALTAFIAQEPDRSESLYAE